MKIIIRTVLLALTLLGGYLIDQAQTPRIEAHGWKLVFVGYYDEKSFIERDNKDYGRPSVVYFAKDAPFKIGKEYPKLLDIQMIERLTVDSHDVGPQIRMTLSEYDCRRGLCRTLKTFWTDGSETSPKEMDLLKWSDILEGTPAEALLKYACRPRTASKP